MIRAKFRCNSITRHDSGDAELQTIHMTPVAPKSGDKTAENAAFWKATPNGAIELQLVNLEAAAQFELGKEYHVDFARAE